MRVVVPESIDIPTDVEVPLYRVTLDGGLERLMANRHNRLSHRYARGARSGWISALLPAEQ
jgi:hypothetical protein